MQISKLNSGKLSGLTKIKRLSLKKKKTFSVRSGLTESQVCLVTVFPLPVREETTVEESGIYKINIYLSFLLCQELCIYFLLSLPNPVKLVLLLTFYHVEISTEKN